MSGPFHQLSGGAVRRIEQGGWVMRVTGSWRRVGLAVALVSAIAGVAVLAARVALRVPEALARPDPLLALVDANGLSFAAASGAAPRPVLRGSFSDAAWSMDGRWLAVTETFDADRPGIVILDATGRRVSHIDDVLVVGPIAWSPAGPVVLTTAQGHIRGQTAMEAYDPDAGLAWSASLPDEGGREWRRPLTIAWRPDGAWAAVDLRRERNLCHETVLIPAGADHRGRLFADHEAMLDCSAHRPAWSGDGRRLAMLHGEGDCWPWLPDESACPGRLVVYPMDPLDPGAPPGVPLTVARNVRSVTQPLWLPGDGALLVTRVMADERHGAVVDVALVQADGSGERSIGTLATHDPLVRWGVPGKTILYRVGQPASGGNPETGELREFDLATGRSRTLAPAVFAGALGPVPAG
jgi:hypothetical protein